jgi:hypothetical protein
LAVYNYLRRIYAVQSELLRVPALSFAEEAGGVRIDPAVAVPIINVFAQDNQISTSERLLFIQRLQQPVCRRAARTALGCEQLQ